VAGQASVLVACSDSESRCALASILADLGLDPVVVSSVDEARAILLGQPVRLVFCEDNLPDGGFHDVLRAVKLAGTGVPLVVCSLLGEMDEYLDAMTSGAFDFIVPPFRSAELESIVSSVLQECPSRTKKQPLAQTASPVLAKAHKLAS